MISCLQMTYNSVQPIVCAIRSVHHLVMSQLVIVSASTLMQVLPAVNARKALPRIHRLKSVMQRVSAKPMAEMLIAMAMVVAGSRVALQSVLVLLASRTTVLSTVQNALIQYLNIHNVR
jgi:DNA-directed RNA polymerase subunit H (RpoH/RPB5)